MSSSAGSRHRARASPPAHSAANGVIRLLPVGIDPRSEGSSRTRTARLLPLPLATEGSPLAGDGVVTEGNPCGRVRVRGLRNPHEKAGACAPALLWADRPAP